MIDNCGTDEFLKTLAAFTIGKKRCLRDHRIIVFSLKGTKNLGILTLWTT